MIETNNLKNAFFFYPMVLIVLPFFSLLSACDDSKRNEDPDSSTDTDADSDTDTDSDTDADSGVDSGTPDYWTWNEVVIPNTSVGICYSYAEPRVLALSDTDVVVCAGFWGEPGGGLAEFDGTTLTVSTLPSGNVSDFGCENLWSDGDTVWAWGAGGWGTVNYVDYYLLRREDGTWIEETVEGLEDCFSGIGSCAIQAMYMDASGIPHAVGWLDASWWAFTPGTRVVWSRDPGTGDWLLDDSAVFPSFDLLTGTSTGVGSLGILLSTLSGDVTYWGGGGPVEAHVFEIESSGIDVDASVVDVDASIVDMEYPPSKSLKWLGWSGDGDILASTGFELLEYDGITWSELTETTCEPGPWPSCWNVGAVDATGDVFLAGGRGAYGDIGPDQWRIHHWDGTNLSAILEPCPGDNPYCGISGLSTSESRVYAAGKSDWDRCVLMWAELP